jgi:phage baseplate assembly protein W|tara:strand:+ start:164 stop:562 length:399 start_codon:yes stop_codon:yes gene_type:complete
MPVKISRGFRDISLSFKRHPITNDVIPLKNEDAIKKSVINLVRTKVGERFFNDLLGTSVGDTLFELNSFDNDVLREEIIALLSNYEPRITLTNVFVEADKDSNDLFIQIEYDITGLPLPRQNIEFILQPSRV